MSDSWQKIDVNSRGSLTAVSSVDDQTIVRLVADPITGALLVTFSGGATTVYTETPVGLINNVNTTYTTIHTINNIFSFAINGMFLHPRDIAAGTGDYTFSGNTITFLTALPSSLAGTSFTIAYQ